jgi:hypothetical protein
LTAARPLRRGRRGPDISHLRREKKFPSVEELKIQLKKDEKNGRAFFLDFSRKGYAILSRLHSPLPSFGTQASPGRLLMTGEGRQIPKEELK